MNAIETRPAPSAFTVHQVAQRFNVSSRTVWTWIAAGKLRALKLGPRTTRVPEDALAEFLHGCAGETR